MTMSKTPPSSHAFRVSDLKSNKTHRFDIRPDDTLAKMIAEELDLLGLRKMRFKGELRPEGKSNWLLLADLGATVVQPCTVSLAPVTTRIDCKVRRHFLSDMTVDDVDELEMPEDDTSEPLQQWIDPESVMTEALSLEVPDYPRADSAEFQTVLHAEKGVVPMTDEAAKPFAGLASLRDKLNKDD